MTGKKANLLFRILEERYGAFAKTLFQCFFCDNSPIEKIEKLSYFNEIMCQPLYNKI